MKYYGIKNRLRREKLLYFYAHTVMWLQWHLSVGKKRKWRREHFNETFSTHANFQKKYSNEIPNGHYLELNSIITEDLVAREDINKLKHGLKKLLKHYRSAKFLGGPIEGLDELCSKLENMDSAGLSWYNTVNFGAFDFNGSTLESDFEYFTITIRNINASFLAVELEIHLTEKAQKPIQEMIVSDFHDDKGYIHLSLMAKRGKRGAKAKFIYTVS